MNTTRGDGDAGAVGDRRLVWGKMTAPVTGINPAGAFEDPTTPAGSVIDATSGVGIEVCSRPGFAARALGLVLLPRRNGEERADEAIPEPAGGGEGGEHPFGAGSRRHGDRWIRIVGGKTTSPAGSRLPPVACEQSTRSGRAPCGRRPSRTPPCPPGRWGSVPRGRWASTRRSERSSRLVVQVTTGNATATSPESGAVVEVVSAGRVVEEVNPVAAEEAGEVPHPDRTTPTPTARTPAATAPSRRWPGRRRRGGRVFVVGTATDVKRPSPSRGALPRSARSEVSGRALVPGLPVPAVAPATTHWRQLVCNVPHRGESAPSRGQVRCSAGEPRRGRRACLPRR